MGRIQGKGGLSAAGLGGHAPATSLPVAGAGSQRGRDDLLGDAGTDPSRPGGRKEGGAQGQSYLATLEEPEVRDLKIRKDPRPPSPPPPPLQSTPWVVGVKCELGATLMSLSRAPWRGLRGSGDLVAPYSARAAAGCGSCSPVPSCPTPTREALPKVSVWERLGHLPWVLGSNVREKQRWHTLENSPAREGRALGAGA